MKEGYIFVSKLKIDVGLICHLSSAKNIEFQIALSSIRWIIVFGMSLMVGGEVHPHQLEYCETLINQLKLSLKKICPEVVFESYIP